MNYHLYQHDYDVPTGFCIRCGSHRETIEIEGSGCISPDANVTAISHLRAIRIMGDEREYWGRKLAEIAAHISASSVAKVDCQGEVPDDKG